MRNMRTQSILHPGRLVTVTPLTSLNDALSIMRERKIHHLLVVSDEKFVGLLAEQDLPHLLLTGEKSGDLEFFTVERAMRSDVPVISETTGLEQALELMLGSGSSALPVVREGKLIGILTETDLLRLLQALLRRGGPWEAMVNRGEELLSGPLVQNVLKTLSDIGL